MMIGKAQRSGVRSGAITSSVRFWLTPRVRVGGRYPMEDGFIEVTRLQEVDPSDITETVATEGGFESLEALLTAARHGRGERVFIVDFVFVPG
jgi:hypothetical protein